MTPPICPYCQKAAVLHESSAAFYHGRNYGPVWACEPCAAWVGCHKNSRKRIPLGRLANKELRAAKINAHAAFDVLWKRKMEREGISKKQARTAGYRWLGEQMGLPPSECHIGMFDADQCRRAAAICTPFIGKSEAA